MDDIEDLRTVSFDEFTTFYFANPRRLRWSTGWHNHVEILYEPVPQANFFIELFQAPSVLLQKFDLPQIDEGIWAISSIAFDGNAYDIVLQDDAVPFELKRQCIKAMYDLFKDLFSVVPVEASAFWWNKFAGFKQGAVWEPGEPAQLADTIFETLLRMLDLDSDYCRSCAIDGIRQLRHRNTAEELRAFLRQKSRLDKQTRALILKVVEANPPFPL